jgi:hypothetical protein
LTLKKNGTYLFLQVLSDRCEINDSIYSQKAKNIGVSNTRMLEESRTLYVIDDKYPETHNVLRTDLNGASSNDNFSQC